MDNENTAPATETAALAPLASQDGAQGATEKDTSYEASSGAAITDDSLAFLYSGLLENAAPPESGDGSQDLSDAEYLLQAFCALQQANILEASAAGEASIIAYETDHVSPMKSAAWLVDCLPFT